ncbi:serine/threonine-protein phosphatase PP1 [Diaphorina citri]|uniref:Serine/threonine-protein phosphatase n=1 Tax=Diaphorina citri TaxID=121845 RepID=A0A1S3D0W5_DIACI|nr:serine/threonine-protein phosphatase PP1 [Diaphorina citri]KAI5711938.1 hypothetical protein M8J75_004438 [Diaphorina citri]KAI5749442.1 hypothetical protein M8J76_007362 [Diaphorina citri]KAI5753998.1 hypothetical protein M8J77_004918 [Diaphorina citri]
MASHGAINQESLDNVIKKLSRGVRPGRMINLDQADIVIMIRAARDIFMAQPMFLYLTTPLKICGDIHGQYNDLLGLFSYGKPPPTSTYLFLGDYVDRGKHSIETICLLFAYKIRYPDNIYLLRGNHESANINKIYGFYEECKRRYDIKLWKKFTDCFNCMPVAAVVDHKIFCCHGGLSPQLTSFSQITNLPRPTEVPEEGLLVDLLWSDPEENISGWGHNDRGVSYTFGADMVHEFLKKFNIDLVCRAHQVVEEGYEFFADKKLVTLFSAPNYCGEFDNAGAMMIVDENLTCSFHIMKPKKKILEFLSSVMSGEGSSSSIKKNKNY